MASPKCFCCGREATRLDRQIDQWVCENNGDCSMSMGPEGGRRKPVGWNKPTDEQLREKSSG